MSSAQQARSDGQRQDLLLLAVLAIPFLLIAYVWVTAKSGLETRYIADAPNIAVPEGEAALVEGKRQARVRGCFWCHGESMEGKGYFASADRGIILISPNLTKKIREYSTEDFVRALRYGIRPDGTSLQPAMPSFAFYNMSDEDLGYLLAYIQSLPELEGLQGEYRLMPVGWIRWTLNLFPNNVAGLIDHDAPRTQPAKNGPAEQHGRYLAESVCTECHSDNGRLRVPVTPNLNVAVGYTRDEFFHLMRTGEPRHERPLDYHMVEVSQYRYGEMTDAEIDALYAYFQSFYRAAALAEKPDV